MKRKKWGNLLDRANMQDKARRREWRGLVCVEVCKRYKIAVASWASMTGQEQEQERWMDGWMGNI